MFPESEKYAQKSLSIPLYPGLSEEDQNYVKEKLLSLLK